VRVVGGVLRREQLAGLGSLARDLGDGTLHLTARANVQLRGVPMPVPPELVRRTEALGLLPSAEHERVRNIMVSPLTGRLGGVADLRGTAVDLDDALCADPVLAGLPARFLFVLDDRHARLVAAGTPGDVVPLTEVPARLLHLARRFLHARGDGPSAAWHVRELPGGAAALGDFSGQTAAADRAPRPPYGRLRQDNGRTALHRAVPEGTVSPDLLDEILAEAADAVVVTPWRSLLLTDLESRT
jgi:precorrin-3B synthase